MAQTEEFMFPNVTYRPTVYRTGGVSFRRSFVNVWFPNEVIGHNMAKTFPKLPLDSYYVSHKVSDT